MKTKRTMICTLAALLLVAPVGLRAAPAGGQDGDGQAAKILVKQHKKVMKKKVVGHHGYAPVRRYVPVRRYRPVVRHTVVVHQPVVVPAHETVVVHRRERRTVVRDTDETQRLGVALRVVAATVQGEMLNLATVENPTMGGLGIQFRGKVSEHWGLELGLDWLRGGDGTEVVQTTFPLMLSAYYQFFPGSRFRPHVLAGLGAHFTKLEYAGGFRYDTVQFAGQLGAGLEIKITDWFGLTADARLLGLFKNLGSQSSIERECIQTIGGKAGYCNGLSTLDTNDQWNIGAQFMAGATIYF
ncbi:MAG: porin family protein [Pseudomonadota bacterium]